MRLARAKWAALASAAGCALTLSAPAAAETYARTDPAGDMWSEASEQEPAPDADNADIRQVSVDHRLHNVVITMTYTDLRWEHGFLVPLDGKIRTNERKVRYIEIIRFDEDSTWRVRVFNGNYDRIKCGPVGAVDLQGNTATMRLPRGACLSNPTWIRAALGSTSQRPDSDGPGFDPPSDNALTAGPWFVDPTYTPRIYRG